MDNPDANGREVDFSKVGDTAKLVAYFRRYTGNELNSRISYLADAEEAALKFFKGDRKKMDAAVSWMPLVLEMRQKGILSVVKDLFKMGTPANLLEVGAGIDFCAVDYFGTDGSSSQMRHIITDYNQDLVKVQREVISKIVKPEYNVVVEQLDVLDEAKTRKLVGFFEGQRHLRTSAGVLPYLKYAQRGEALRIAAETMPGGSYMVTTDIMTRDTLEKLLRGKPERFELVAAISERTGLELIDNAYINESDALAQIDKSGLRVVERVPQFDGRGYSLDSIDVLKKQGVFVDEADIISMGQRPIWILTPKA